MSLANKHLVITLIMYVKILFKYCLLIQFIVITLFLIFV